MLYYTSITSCYLPLARVLGETLLAYNPDAELYIVLSDDPPEAFDIENEPFKGVLYGKDIKLEYVDMSTLFWIYLHDKTELCTAVKGWAALELLKRTGANKIVYLDPDIAVLHSLDNLEKELDSHDVIVSPHRLAPEPRFDGKFYGDQQFLTRGVFNLGFVAIHATSNGLSFLRWWQKMLEEYCYVDDLHGLFTDQKLIDLAPAFFNFVHISRNEGYNISWWNVTQRKLSGPIDNISVNGKPAYFYHFSQWNSGLHKNILSEYCGDNPFLTELITWYESRLEANGAKNIESKDSIYDRYTNGQRILPHARQASRLRSDVIQNYARTNPFDSEDPAGLYQYYLSYFPENINSGLSDSTTTQDGKTDYQSLYLTISSSRSYKLSRKISKFANAVFPRGSVQRNCIKRIAHFYDKKMLKARYIQLAREEQQQAPADNRLPFPGDSTGVLSAYKDLEPEAVRSMHLLATAEKLPCTVIIRNVSSLEDVYRMLYIIKHQASAIPSQIVIAYVKGASELARLRNVNTDIEIVDEAPLLELLKVANQDIVFSLNKWIGISDDYFEKGMAAITRYKAALLQPMLLNEYGYIFEAGAVILQSGKRIPYGPDGNPSWSRFRYAKEVDTVSPLAFVIRKLDVESFDIDQQEWDQEYQLCDISLRLRARGMKVMYASSFCAFNASDCLYHAPQMAENFFCKWRDSLLKESIASEADMFLGRDRSQGRKVIFVSDDRVPRPDFSAGDRTMRQYLQVWVKLGYSIKYVGDEMIRVEPYDSEAEDLGVELIGVDGRGDMEWQAFIAQYGCYIDYAFLCRPHILPKYIDALKTFGKPKIIYDCVDLAYLRQERACELNGDTQGLLDARKTKTLELRTMKKADIVLTISTYEKEVLASDLKFKKVLVCPIFVYDSFPIINDDFSKRHDLMFVGGFKHIPNGDAMVWFCNEVLPRIREKLPDVKMHIVGNNPPMEVEALASDNVIVHGYVSDEELAELYSSLRMVVIPLRFGAGVKGKLVEAMYYGMPIVSTSIGTEGLADIEKWIPADDTAEEFAQQVIKLYQSDSLLKKAASENQMYVKKHYSEGSALVLFRELFSK